jgi:hypothetical protein
MRSLEYIGSARSVEYAVYIAYRYFLITETGAYLISDQVRALDFLKIDPR